jgi:hypothetical protein
VWTGVGAIALCLIFLPGSSGTALGNTPRGTLVILAAITVLLSRQPFERMSMTPGYLLAAVLVVAAAHRIGTRSLDPVASAVVGAFTIAWMGAVGAALY